jgi:predicted transcriptional regulator
MGSLQFNLKETLDQLKITRNKLAVESKTRPATILDLVSGDTKRLELSTIVAMLDTLNQFAKEKGYREITFHDILEYIPDNNE